MGRPRRDGRLRMVDPEQYALELAVGLNALDVDDDTLRRAWGRLREQMLAESRPGRRPWAWWEFEVEMAYPSLDDEAAVLAALGELCGDEIEAVLADGDRILAMYPAQWMPLDPLRDPCVVRANNLRAELGLPLLTQEDFEAAYAAYRSARVVRTTTGER